MPYDNAQRLSQSGAPEQSSLVRGGLCSQQVSPVSSGDVGLDVALRPASGAYRLVRVLGRKLRLGSRHASRGPRLFVTTICRAIDALGVWQMGLFALPLLMTGEEVKDIGAGAGVGQWVPRG